VDCERLKRNYNFWQRQNKGSTYDIFRDRYKAVLNHHFGDHTYCQSKEEGGWCRFKGNDSLIAEAKLQNRYRDKTKDIQLYELVLKIWEHFGTELMLEQVFHRFMSQKSESLHQQISRIAPKDKHFSNSMALSDRVALAVITDSVGYEQGMKMILEEIDIQVPTVTEQYLVRRNDRRQYDRMYHQRLDVKNRRYATKKENIRRDLEQKAIDAKNGTDYGPSIDIEDVVDSNDTTPVSGKNEYATAVTNNDTATGDAATGRTATKKRRKAQKDLVCKQCREKGHGTWRNHICTKYKEYLAQHGM